MWNIFKSIATFFKTGLDKPIISQDPEIIRESYEPKRLSVFLAVTLSYSLYYVCRLNFSVVKKVLLEKHILDAEQLGMMGSAMFFTYALGKFFNGFMADRLNIKRFMSLGLFVSAFIQLVLGNVTYFWFFVILWGLNGWFQSFGAAPSVVSLSQWFSPRELGTYYGIWIISHNVGAALTTYFTARIVNHYGWQWGFIAPGVLCIVGAITLYSFMYDRPQTLGLPMICEYKHELKSSQQETLWQLQLAVIKNPAVWILGLASACMYIARYAIESWGMVFLGGQKGYTTIDASKIMVATQIAGAIGTILSGYITDKFFHSRRNLLALICGLLYSISLCVFLWYPGRHVWLDYLNMTVFGFSLGVLLCFLGGLMAVDICSKRAAGAAMGMIGLFSYLATAVQDYVSGYLIDAHKTIVDEKTVYDFGPVSMLWVGATVLSVVLATLVWKTKPKG